VTAQPGGAPAEHLLRELAPQVLGAVIRRFRDFAAAEDAVQEALELAGDYQAATARYRQAAGRTTSVPERNYLLSQAARLRESAEERR